MDMRFVDLDLHDIIFRRISRFALGNALWTQNKHFSDQRILNYGPISSSFTNAIFNLGNIPMHSQAQALTHACFARVACGCGIGVAGVLHHTVGGPA